VVNTSEWRYMCDNRQTVDYAIVYKPHRSPPSKLLFKSASEGEYVPGPQRLTKPKD